MAKDYYRILGVPNGASLNEIKKAYRDKAKEYHPDINDHPRAGEAFVLVNEAYSYLSDPVRRASLDRRRHKRYTEEKRRKEYRRWTEQEQQRVRRRAEENATMSFEEFAKKPIYKAAMVLDEVYNYIFIAMGVVMIVGPVVGAVFMNDEPNEDYNYYSLIIPVLMGVGFILGVWHFAIKGEEE